MTNGATPSNNSNSPIRQAYTDTKKSIMKPFSDFAASCNTSTIGKLCQATWNNPLEFLGRTVATGVIGAIGLAATVAAFNAWPSLAAIGGVVAVVGLIIGAPPLIALGFGIGTGPIGVAAATVGIIIANYADFIKNNQSETERNTSATNNSDILTKWESTKTDESERIKFINEVGTKLLTNFDPDWESKSTAQRISLISGSKGILLKNKSLPLFLSDCLNRIKTEKDINEATTNLTNSFSALNKCSETEKGSNAYQECLKFAKIEDDGNISLDPNKLKVNS